LQVFPCFQPNKTKDYNAPVWSPDQRVYEPTVFPYKMPQPIKVTTSVTVKFFMKQKRRRCNGWPLVRRPDGGSHEWLIWACEREGTPTEAKECRNLLKILLLLR
jgi:hypothetical protein